MSRREVRRVKENKRMISRQEKEQSERTGVPVEGVDLTARMWQSTLYSIIAFCAGLGSILFNQLLTYLRAQERERELISGVPHIFHMPDGTPFCFFGWIFLVASCVLMLLAARDYMDRVEEPLGKARAVTHVTFFGMIAAFLPIFFLFTFRVKTLSSVWETATSPYALAGAYFTVVSCFAALYGHIRGIRIPAGVASDDVKNLMRALCTLTHKKAAARQLNSGTQCRLPIGETGNVIPGHDEKGRTPLGRVLED